MSEFDALKLRLHDELNRLGEMTQNQETLAKIHAIQQCIAKLEQQ